jgi:hypothetical protein
VRGLTASRIKRALHDLREQQANVQKLLDKFRKTSNQRDDPSIVVAQPESEEFSTYANATIEKVTQLQQKWKKEQTSAFGKVRTGVVGFLNALSQYSSLFSVIPVQDKYFSLITGVVWAVTQVRVAGLALPLLSLDWQTRRDCSLTRARFSYHLPQPLLYQPYLLVHVRKASAARAERLGEPNRIAWTAYSQEVC